MEEGEAGNLKGSRRKWINTYITRAGGIEYVRLYLSSTSDEVKADPAVTTCSIPLHAGVESLNAGVAGSVMLYEAARQRAA